MKKFLNFRENREKRKSEKLAKEEEEKTFRTKIRFDDGQIKDLKGRFEKIANTGDHKMNRKQFRENMGLLGLDTAFYLSDKIFEMLDKNKDEKVEFEDFLIYMDVLMNGNQEEKTELSYCLIDTQQKGFFDLEDFTSLMKSIINVWSSITGNYFGEKNMRKIDYYIQSIFKQIDVLNQGKVTLADYKAAIKKNPNLLEIFDYLNQGVSDVQEAPEKEDKTKNKNIAKKLHFMELTLDSIILNLQGDQMNLDALSRNQNSNNNYLNSNYLRSYTKMRTLKESEYEEQEQQLPDFLKNIDINFDKNYSGFDKQILSTNFSNPTKPPAYGSLLKQEKYKESYEELKPKSTDIDRISLPPLSSCRKPVVSSYISPIKFSQEEEDFGKICIHGDDVTELKGSLIGSPNAKTFTRRKTSDINNDMFLRKMSRNLGRRGTNLLSGDDLDNLQPNSRQSPDSFLRKQSSNVMEKSEPQTPQIIKEFKSKTMCTITELKQLKGLAQYLRKEMEIDMKPETKGIEEDDKKKFLELRIKTEEIKLKKLQTATAANVYRGNPRKSLSLNSKDKLKRQKSLVFVGHQNWNLVLNMMLGIQTAVKSLVVINNNALSTKDFQLKYYFELVPKRTGEKEKEKISKFYDYAPYVFNEIRRIHDIKNEEYLKSIGPETMLSNLIKGNLSSLQELVSTGKSGSFFYYTADGKFTLKTIHRNEFATLLKILPQYYEYLTQNKDSLLIRFFGLHKIRYREKKMKREKRLYFLIMANIFNTEKEIHEKYDIKGSLYKRFTIEDDPTCVKKDKNLIMNKFKLRLTIPQKNSFGNAIKKDSQFLRENNIMDYSLLIGVHNLSKSGRRHIQQEDFMKSASVDMNDSKASGSLCLSDKKMWLSEDGKNIYFLGVIDILTSFNTKKKLEYLFKRMAQGKKISAIPASPYSERFINFILKNVIDYEDDIFV